MLSRTDLLLAFVEVILETLEIIPGVEKIEHNFWSGDYRSYLFADSRTNNPKKLPYLGNKLEPREYPNDGRRPSEVRREPNVWNQVARIERREVEGF